MESSIGHMGDQVQVSCPTKKLCAIRSNENFEDREKGERKRVVSWDQPEIDTNFMSVIALRVVSKKGHVM